MKSLDQFNALTNQELMEINGGAGLADLLATLNAVLVPATNATSASLLILSAGASSAVNTIAGGLAAFLSKLSLPTV
ncbi:MAG: hypothetical protein J7578_06365 [Chitinophagaceae bacterium]|nr:hypothetical protein [Chitinophagaceae bacterium]